MEIWQFLELVTPRGEGHVCVAVQTENGFQQFWATGWKAAPADALSADAKDAYFALARFTETKRKQDNAVALRAFWLDIDTQETKPKAAYVDRKEAVRAVAAFAAEVGLPKPWLVSSGGGIHVYWPLDCDIAPSDWRPIADALKEACKRQELHADHAITADCARVLRLPGTLHAKTGRKVRLVRQGEIVPPAAFRGALAAWMDMDSDAPTGPQPTAVAVAANNDLTGGLEYPTSYAEKIAEHCAVIGLMRDTRGDVDQPTWYGSIGVLAFTDEADGICHAWSNGHTKYSPLETNAKILQARKFKPTSCKKLSDAQPALCQACQHYGKITSPISLGIDRRAVEVLPSHTETVVCEPTPSIADLPKRLYDATAIDLLNQVIGFTHNWGGQATYFVLEEGFPRPITKNELQEMLANVFVETAGDDGKVESVRADKYWLHHPRRTEHPRTSLDPERAWLGPRDRNLWTGVATHPAEGRCRLMLAHLRTVLCAGNRRHFKYLLRWLAHAVQRPGTAPGTVVVLKSEAEGTGKSTLIRWMAQIIGQRHAAEFNTVEQLLGHFNAHLEPLVFIGVNEPSFAGDHAINRKLKSMVSDSQWMIEPKYMRPYPVRNVAHMMFTSNDSWAVSAGAHARRFFVLNVSDSRAGDHRYFKALNEEADAGGLEAFLRVLLRIDLSAFDPVTDLPVTEGLREQQMLSLPPEAQWLMDLATAEETRLPSGAVIKTAASATSEDLFASYEAHVAARRGRPMARTSLGRWFRKVGLQPARVGSSSAKGWHLPDGRTLEGLVLQAAGIRAAQ
jgi:hypothetical protein